MDSKATKKMFLYNITTGESLLLMDKTTLSRVSGLSKQQVKLAFMYENKVHRFKSGGCEYVAYSIDQYVNDNYTGSTGRDI